MPSFVMQSFYTAPNNRVKLFPLLYFYHKILNHLTFPVTKMSHMIVIITSQMLKEELLNNIVIIIIT